MYVLKVQAFNVLQEIDTFLENARDRSYQTMVDVGSRGINLAANAVVTAAVKGQTAVSNKLRSYSVTDLTRIPENEGFGRPPLSEFDKILVTLRSSASIELTTFGFLTLALICGEVFLPVSGVVEDISSGARDIAFDFPS